MQKEGGDVERTILSHMNPSHDDFGYQAAVAEQGAFVEYDMLGMDHFYLPDNSVPAIPNASAGLRVGIARMVAAGYAERLLLSQDVFLKIMLTRYGGFGYARILRNTVPALRKIGLSDDVVEIMLVRNPRRLVTLARS